MLTPSKATYLAGVAIPAGARVKLKGDGTNTVILSGIGDVDFGTAGLFQGYDNYVVGASVTTIMLNHPGSRTCLASGVINHSDPVYTAANGRVSSTRAPGSTFFGVALDTCVDGDNVEVVYQGGQNAQAEGGKKLLIVNGVDSSAGPANIVAAAVAPTDTINEVINLTDYVVLTPANFTPGAGIITQLQAAGNGNLSAKKLQFRLVGKPVE